VGSWRRHGERYDILPEVGLFKSHDISLATEKGEKDGRKGTKLKCKLHNLVPELLYERSKKSYCYPTAGRFAKTKGVEPKFKLEQDVHFNNTKYCATGYLIIPGDKHRFGKVGDFLHFFPRLKDLSGVQKDIPLLKVRDWQETVFDDLKFRIGDWDFDGALVTRRDTHTGAWVESEFSFKIKPPKDKKSKKKSSCLDPCGIWDHRKLRKLAAIYDELYATSTVFIQQPPIFYFSNPVSSVDI
jgi:hypothetical protein